VKEKRSRRILVYLGSLILMVLAVITAFPACATAPAPSTGQPIKLVFTSHEPPTGFITQDFYKPWFADLEKRTGGKVKIEAHYAGELFGPPDAYGAAVKGTVDMAHLLPGPPDFPTLGMIQLSSTDVFCNRRSRIFWELYQSFPEMRADFKNVKVLFVGSAIWAPMASRSPIRKIEDCKGVKVLMGGTWVGEREQALGFTLANVPPADLFSALQKGVMDATTITWFFYHDFGIGNTLKYVTNVSFYAQPFACVMNLNTWNKLPKDVQKVIDDMIPELVDRFDQVQWKAETALREASIKEFGTQLIELPKDEIAKFAAAFKPATDKFAAEMEAKGVPGKKLVAEYQRLEKKYSAPENLLK